MPLPSDRPRALRAGRAAPVGWFAAVEAGQSLLVRAGRKREGKDASATGGRLGPDPSSVSLDDAAAGGEADAAALVPTATALEHLEDSGVSGQTDPVVAHRERPAGLALLRGHRHERRLAAMKLDGVGDQVLKDPEQ